MVQMIYRLYIYYSVIELLARKMAPNIPKKTVSVYKDSSSLQVYQVQSKAIIFLINSWGGLTVCNIFEHPIHARCAYAVLHFTIHA